ncbi:MAG: diguanylate cyclase [Candidatus Omnitrophica bacterium]|nr:diguanylate cyclase [Candidatus Omnitrophota bacterium]MBU4479015.1 diguanylate cyclase [Candidatus Omnitrophota bacterium]MCG2703810.1 diguanylate cyclase [Candidatus Omnitrophota bacterium]
MSIYAFIPFICGLLCLGSGFFILSKARKSYLSRPYFLASMIISGYFFMNFCLMELVRLPEMLAGAKVFAFAGFFVVPALLNILFQHNKRGLFKVILFFSFILSLFVFYYLKAPIKVVRFPWGSALAIQDISVIFFFINVALFLPLGVVIFRLQTRKRKISQLSKRQINFNVLAMSAGFVFLCVNMLPGFGINVYPFGLPLLAIAFISMSYSIIRYRFLEMDLIINRTVVSFLFIAPLLAGHVIISGLFLSTLGFVFSTTFSLLVIISIALFTPYRRLLQKMVEKAVYRGRYDYQKVLKELCQTITAILDFDQLFDHIVHVIVQTIEVEKTAVFLSDDDGQNFRIKASNGVHNVCENSLTLKADEPIIKRLQQAGRILVKDELLQFEDENRIMKMFKPLDALETELVVPLLYKENLLGFIVLSRKISGNIYNQGDIDVLETFSVEAAKAIEHVRLYNEAIVDRATKVFNQNYFLMRLREEIARAKRYRHPISLMFIEIDSLEGVDNVLGHANTDLILKGIGLLLKTKIRSVDVLSRFSGRKFAVILPETAKSKSEDAREMLKKHVKDTLIVAERLRSGVENFTDKSGGISAGVTVSIGIAYFEGSDEHFSEEQFIEQAESALMDAKKTGKNKVVSFEVQK